MAGKKGFLSGIVDAAKSELFDDDEKTHTADPAVAAAQAPPAPAPTPTMPYTFGTSPAGATTPISSPAGMVMPGAPEPVDPKVFEMVSGGVFIDIAEGAKSRPSRYMMFSKMWDALGRPADANVPLRAMQVNDSSITPVAVLKDIDAHLKLLDGVAANAATELDNAAAQKLGGADQQLAALTQANEAAAREIERHTKETAERNTQAIAIQTQRATDEANINRAKSRTQAAVDMVRAQLQGARNLFATLS